MRFFTMIHINPVKRALAERKVSLGAWIQIGHPAVAEMFAEAGFDWIAVDCEHSDMSLADFSNIARGMNGTKAVPFARVRENDTLAIRQILDAGAGGVIVPLVNTAEEAQKAVAAAKYPPEGIRGFAYCRANNWGTGFDEYAKNANRETVVIIMIESKQAVGNIDGILEVSGVDGVFIGPYDMSGSYGVVGQTGHESVRNAYATVLDACARHGKAAGIHIVDPAKEAIEKAISDGFTFIALGMDTVFITGASREALEVARTGRG